MKTLIVEVPEDQDDWTIHRLRNLGEHFHRSGAGRVDFGEVDSATWQFHVFDIPRRDRGAVLKLAEKLIERNGLTGIATVHWEG